MDHLKDIVIQSLEQEGTLSALKAQLRSRVFQAIEQNADNRTKQMVGFQWQNPYVQKIHTTEESLLSAHLVQDFLDHYKMDYTKSVYIPEVALAHSQLTKEGATREDIQKLVGVEGPESMSSEPIMVQILKTMKQQKMQIAQLSAQVEKQSMSQLVNHTQNQRDKNNSQQSSNSQPSRDGTPSPLMQQQQQMHAQNQKNSVAEAKNEMKKKFSNNFEEDGIQEEIIDEVLELQQQQSIGNVPKSGDPLASSDALGMSGGISSSGANAIDHSIDTLQLEQYDYVEEVKLN